MSSVLFESANGQQICIRTEETGLGHVARYVGVKLWRLRVTWHIGLRKRLVLSGTGTLGVRLIVDGEAMAVLRNAMS